MDRVRINVTKLALFAYHGVNDEEQKLGQRFYIDMALVVAPVTATRTDKLDDTISYEDVIHCAEDAFLEKNIARLNAPLMRWGMPLWAVSPQFRRYRSRCINHPRPSPRFSTMLR